MCFNFKSYLKFLHIRGCVNCYCHNLLIYDIFTILRIVDKNLTLCEKHSSSGCKDGSKCNGLHICKFYILSKLCEFGDSCKFGHNLDDPHNDRLLQKANISNDAAAAYFKSNRTAATMPFICKFYNVGSSPKCTNARCQCLHCCRYFVDGNCTFGGRCRRTHQFTDEHNSNILRKYGFPGTFDDTKFIAFIQHLLQTCDVSTEISERKQLHPKADENKYTKAKKNPRSSVSYDDNILCSSHLEDNCHDSQCSKLHSTQPFLWRYLDPLSNGMVKFNRISNELLEKYFCDVKGDKCVVNATPDESTARYSM